MTTEEKKVTDTTNPVLDFYQALYMAVRYQDEKELGKAQYLHMISDHTVSLPIHFKPRPLWWYVMKNEEIPANQITAWRQKVCLHLFKDLIKQMRTYKARALMRDWKKLSGLEDDLFVCLRKYRLFHESGEKSRFGGFTEDTAGSFTVIPDNSYRYMRMLEGKTQYRIHYCEVVTEKE